MSQKNTLRDVKVRGIEPSVLQKIDEQAAEKGLSRESYLRNVIRNLSVAGEIKAVEDKYENLVVALSEIIINQNEIIERNNYLYEEVMKKLGDLK